MLYFESSESLPSTGGHSSGNSLVQMGLANPFWEFGLNVDGEFWMLIIP